MKKKIALLLAGVMAMSTLPMVSFAATSNTTNNTIYISTESKDVPVSVYDALKGDKVPADVTIDYATDNASTEGYVDFVIGNGEWEDRGANYDVLVNKYMSDLAKKNDSKAAKWFADPVAVAEYTDTVSVTNSLLAYLLSNSVAKPKTTIVEGIPVVTTGSALTTENISYLKSIVESAKQTYVTLDENDASSASFLAVKAAVNALVAGETSNSAAATIGSLNNAAEGNLKTAKDKKIWLETRLIYNNTATLYVPKGVTGSIPVPIFFEIDSNTSNVTVSVVNRQAGASAGTFTVGQVSTGGTVTYIENADSSKTATIFDIITKETTSGRLEPGAHTVIYKVPSSFNFVSVGKDDSLTMISNTAVTKAVLADKMNLTSGSNYITATVKYATENNKRAIEVVYTIPARSKTNMTELGAIKLADVKIVPEFSSNKFGDILMDVDSKYFNGSSNNVKISSHSNLLVGKFIDWGITLTQVDSTDVPPTLVSGRLEGNVSEESDDNVFTSSDYWDSVGDMKLHQTLEFSFREVVPNSWWAGRETEFTVPEGVNIIGVEFTKVEKVQSANGDGLVLNEEEVFFAKDKSPYVNIEDNVMTLQNLEVFDKAADGTNQKTEVKEKARIDMILWVASDVNFEGDIDVTVGGNAIVDDVEPLTIATTVAPYVLDTKVTTVPLDNLGTGGIQQLAVADVYISETELGRFADGESIFFEIVDGVRLNGAAANGVTIRTADVEVVEGDLSIRKTSFTTGGDLQIDFKDSSSKSKPSTIKVSNLTITVDGTVPITNAEPLQVAISSDLRNNVKRPLTSSQEQTIRFGTVHADYVNVQTYSGSEIEITVGSNVAVVDGVEVELDAAAFIDPATNSTMVPLRFVSAAMGVADENIIWDPHYKTVTIRSNQLDGVLQFKVGSSYHTIGNTSVMNENGAVTQIVSDRTFVPFRTLGYAFNIPVSWDGTARVARFN